MSDQNQTTKMSRAEMVLAAVFVIGLSLAWWVCAHFDLAIVAIRSGTNV